MSYRTEPTQATVNFWIRDIADLHFDGRQLHCTRCNKAISWSCKTNINAHISSENHKRSVGGFTYSEAQSNFNLDLVEFMIGCNIPWSKLDNPLFRQFLEKCISGKYSNVKVPSESTLRKKYLFTECENIRQKISSELNGKYIWLSVDETINACGFKVANVLVGALEENCPMRGHLIASKVLEATNSRTIADAVNSSLQDFWGDKYAENKAKFLLFLTDGVNYMKAAGRILKETYRNILHVTCLAHGLHRIAETIRRCYPNVDKLIANVKKVFLKAPSRIRLFHEILPNTPLPPEPITTRWGTWLKAASYYYCHFENVKSLIQQLNPNDAVAISQAQQAFTDPTLQENLETIHGCFSRIPLAIRDLQYQPTSEITTVDLINVVFDLRQYIFQLQGDIAVRVQRKFQTVLEKNPGFVTMTGVIDLLNGKEVDFATPGMNVVTLRKFRYFKYAPVTSVDVERSFSQYKWIFNERRRSLTPKHLEQILVIYFYTCNRQ